MVFIHVPPSSSQNAIIVTWKKVRKAY